MSGIINKVKEVLHKDHTHSTVDSTNTTHTGAHTIGTTGVTGSHSTHTGAHTTGTTGVTGSHSTHTGTSEGVAGPHNSRVANAVDPRVDSDLDGSRNAGAATGTAGYGATTGTNYGATTGQASHTHTQPIHNSAVLNKLDPRVDNNGALGSSTHTGTHTTGTHTTGGHSHATGTTGGLSSSTNAGPHDSNLANKVDPRVDSDLDGRGNRTGAHTGGILGASGSHATPGSGTAQNTAGPHNSDLANKFDPRVDSDLDGSGGRKTHA